MARSLRRRASAWSHESPRSEGHHVERDLPTLFRDPFRATILKSVEEVGPWTLMDCSECGHEVSTKTGACQTAARLLVRLR